MAPRMQLVFSIVFLFESTWLCYHHSTGFYILMVSVASLWCLVTCIRTFKEFLKRRRAVQATAASDSFIDTHQHESGHTDPPKP
jgi:hypothetical protein